MITETWKNVQTWIKNASYRADGPLATIGIIIFGVFAFAVILGFVAGISLFFTWIFWELWIHVVPYVLDGPPGLIHPNFWLFTGCVWLISWIRNLLFGSKTTTKST